MTIAQRSFLATGVLILVVGVVVYLGMLVAKKKWGKPPPAEVGLLVCDAMKGTIYPKLVDEGQPTLGGDWTKGDPSCYCTNSERYSGLYIPWKQCLYNEEEAKGVRKR